MQKRILNEIKGRMLEDIVLLETQTGESQKQVFVLQFPVGEFDMVVFDPEAGFCRMILRSSIVKKLCPAAVPSSDRQRKMRPGLSIGNGPDHRKTSRLIEGKVKGGWYCNIRTWKSICGSLHNKTAK
ncbi:MAG: hypothetical protein ACLTSZ_08295 [Lachnospiraceae bacterium]